jgi:hypothetical protein
MKSNDIGRFVMQKQRIRAMLAGALATLAPIALAAGCGGGSGSSTASRAEGPPPSELNGTYGTTLRKADLPANPAPGLTSGSRTWTLKIARTGGVDNGPALTIGDNQLGELESSRLGVSGDRLFLHKEICDAGPRFVESEYRWHISGKTLRLEPVKVGCSDKVASTVLSAEPWRRR